MTKNLKTFTRAEVAEHNTRDDAYVIITNKVYDITDWIDKHPGGYRVLLSMAGLDASAPFRVYHPEHIQRRLECFLVGEVVESERQYPDPFSEELFALKEKFLEDGLYTMDFTLYKWLFLEFATLIGITVYCTYFCDSWMAYTIGAVALGFYLQQVAFVGHDLGHTSVTGDWARDYFWGSFLMAVGGLSVSWWKLNHNTHHVVTNSVEHDPDIQHMPFLAVDKKIFEKGSYWSTYYQKWFVFDAAAKFFVSKQHYMFLIVSFFSRFNLYVHSIKTLLLEPVIPNRRIELFGFLAYWTWMYKLCAACGSWQAALYFFLVSHAVAGSLLSFQIGMSHWSMPVFDGKPPTSEGTWFRHQLQTCLDVECSEFWDFFHGGLQFQVTHHLFPRMPRTSQRRAREHVKKVCSKYGIKYHSDTFYGVIRDMIVKFKQAGDDAALTETYKAK